MGDNKIGGFNFDNLLLNFFGDQNAGSEQTNAPQTAQTDEPYVVKNGDTLSKIAAKYGQNLQQVIKKNPQVKNPNRIYVGQKINVGNARSEYTVKNGDTLSSIAKAHNTSVGEILRANPGKINNQNLIYPGQKLRLPQGAETQTPVKTPKKTAPQTKQTETTKTETNAPVQTNPQTVANGEYKPINLDEFLDSRKGSNALAAIIIGNAEGNRTPNGGFTRNYYGHTDPGDKKPNLGSFSYNPRGGGKVANSPQEADEIYLGVLASRRAGYEKAVRAAGLDPNNALLASTYFDAANQSPRAGNKMLAQLDYIKQNGVTPETMKEWRFRGYVNVETGQRWAYPGKNGKTDYAGSGFNNVFKSRTGRFPNESELQQTIRGDQNRRQTEIVKALNAQGYKSDKPVQTRTAPVETPTVPVNTNGNQTETSSNRLNIPHVKFKAGNDIRLSPFVADKMKDIAAEYNRLTGKSLTITDGNRNATEQAYMMIRQIRKGKIGIYRNKQAAAEVKGAYDKAVAGGKSDRQIAADIAKVIQNQINNGTYISPHLRNKGADVRFYDMSAAERSAFRQAANKFGGEVVIENDHFHVQFK